MVPVRGYADRRVAVLGLKGPGLDAARALAAGGAEVTVWDDDGPRRFAAHAAGVTVEDLTERDWGDLAALVVEDAALLTLDEPPRLIELARAVGAPVLAARCLPAEAAAREPGVKLALVAGRHGEAAAALAVHLMDAAGLAVQALSCAGAPKPGGWVVAALSGEELGALSDIVEAEAFVALSQSAGVGSAALERLADAAREALIATAESRPCARLIAKRRGPHAAAVSGRQVLGGGVYAAGGVLFDALDGKPREAGPLTACAPREAIAAGYALARRLGAGREAAAQALSGWPGAPGHGRRVLEVGPVRFIDWSAAHTPAAAVDAVSRGGPVIWIAGPGLSAHAADLLAEAAGAVGAVHLITDRARAAKALGRCAPCTVHRNLDAALLRAVHDALRQGGRDCSLVYAPGSVSGETGAAFRTAAAVLVERALEGDAA